MAEHQEPKHPMLDPDSSERRQYRQPDQWQPIETAPKTPKPLLIYEDWGDGHGCTKVASQSDGLWLSWPGPHEHNPTHWMPLPEAPDV